MNLNKTNLCASEILNATNAKDDVPSLIKRLQDKDEFVREVAVDSLGKIGPKAKEAIPELIELLNDKDVKQAAIIALGKIGPKAKEAIPELIKLLKADDLYIKLFTISALGNIGTAKEVEPKLIELLKEDDNQFVRARAVSVLRRIGSEVN